MLKGIIRGLFCELVPYFHHSHMRFQSPQPCPNEWLPSCSVLQPLFLTPWSLIPLWWAGPPGSKKWWRFRPPNLLYSSNAEGDTCETIQAFGVYDFLNWGGAFDRFILSSISQPTGATTTCIVRLWSTFKGDLRISQQISEQGLTIWHVLQLQP